MHYAVQWYVNASITRDLDNSMKLVYAHTTKNMKNIKKVNFIFLLSCLLLSHLYRRDEIITLARIKKVIVINPNESP